MGVTSFSFDPFDSNYFTSGSYDETLRFWDLRNLKPRNSVLHEEKLGGGVWRIKNHQSESLLGCACMHNHF